jgi:AMMECR1 domain-containing protein
VRTADRSGLLLPRVATDFGLAAEGSLKRVCIKAGLPAQTWLDEAAEFRTFEAYCFGGKYVHPESMV